MGVESIKAKYKTEHSNLVLLDTFGNVVEKIVITSSGEYIGIPYISPKDNLVVFTTEIEAKNPDDFEVFNRPISINVFDYNNRVLKKKYLMFVKM